jgi:hypothetical protein
MVEYYAKGKRTLLITQGLPDPLRGMQCPFVYFFFLLISTRSLSIYCRRRHPLIVLRWCGTRAAATLMAADLRLADASLNPTDQEAAGTDRNPDQHETAGEQLLPRGEIEVHDKLEFVACRFVIG